MNCIPAQRQYCCTQMTYNIMTMLEQLPTEIMAIKKTVADLSEKMNDCYDTDKVVAAPVMGMAQEGSGAEKIDSLNQ